VTEKTGERESIHGRRGKASGGRTFCRSRSQVRRCKKKSFVHAHGCHASCVVAEIFHWGFTTFFLASGCHAPEDGRMPERFKCFAYLEFYFHHSAYFLRLRAAFFVTRQDMHTHNTLMLWEYFVHIDSSCIYCVHKLIKFIKKSKNIHTCSFHPTASVYKISTSNS
jgi:hypothetical protein